MRLAPFGGKVAGEGTVKEIVKQNIDVFGTLSLGFNLLKNAAGKPAETLLRIVGRHRQI